MFCVHLQKRNIVLFFFFLYIYLKWFILLTKPTGHAWNCVYGNSTVIIIISRRLLSHELALLHTITQIINWLVGWWKTEGTINYIVLIIFFKHLENKFIA